MEHHEHVQPENIYACPMHPEITGKQGEKCYKCGMQLTAVEQQDANKYEVELTTIPETLQAGAPSKLRFTFEKENQSFPLEVAHEMKVHLMAVSEDLNWFRHIHPEEQKDGSYVVTETFPGSGKYFLFTDFKPAGAEATVHKQEVEVAGKFAMSKVELSHKVVSTVDGYTLTLKNGDDFKTNRAQPLKITIQRGDRELHEGDVQPYLGATAHIVMIGKDDKNFLHIHPISDKRFPVYAETHVEKPGLYRIWVQFKTNGVVHTADFTVNVEAGNESTGSPGSHSHAH